MEVGGGGGGGRWQEEERWQEEGTGEDEWGVLARGFEKEKVTQESEARVSFCPMRVYVPFLERAGPADAQFYGILWPF